MVYGFFPGKYTDKEQRTEFYKNFGLMIVASIVICFLVFNVDECFGDNKIKDAAWAVGIYIVICAALKFIGFRYNDEGRFKFSFEKDDKKNNCDKNEDKKNKFIIPKLLFFVISPDYLFTYIRNHSFKLVDNETLSENEIEQAEKDFKKKLIVSANICNLVISIVLMIVVVIYINGKQLSDISSIFIFFCFIRLLSRSIEISISFIGDVLDFHNKTSSLDFKGRILLAFSSIFEIIITSWCVYALISTDFGKSFFDAISGLISCCGESSCSCSVENVCVSKITEITRIVSSISICSLLGIVITSYIGEIGNGDKGIKLNVDVKEDNQTNKKDDDKDNNIKNYKVNIKADADIQANMTVEKTTEENTDKGDTK